MSDTVATGDNGRGRNGRFSIGNKYAKGNPIHKATARLRTRLLDAVTADDIEAVVKQLVTMARNGDIAAAREVLDRTIGRPAQTDLLQRIEALERAVRGDIDDED